MIVAVLLKQVEQVYARTGKDSDRLFVNETDRVFLNNPLDEVALEQAVQIKETVGHTQIWVISQGENLMEKEARRALAMGADHFVHLSDPGWGGLDAWALATLLSKAVSKVSASLVLCGSSSLDEMRGEVGVYVANQLSFPYVSDVVGLEIHPDCKSLALERSLGKGNRERLEADLPLCLGVGSRLCEPRYPSRIEKLKARNKPIEQWTPTDLGMDRARLERRVTPGPVLIPKPRTKWIPQLDGGLPAFQRIAFLLSGSSLEKEGTALKGTPKELALSLYSFLEQRGLISRKRDRSQ